MELESKEILSLAILITVEDDVKVIADAEQMKRVINNIVRQF